MAYAVYHVNKGSGSGSGLGHHIDRTEGKEHLYKHADPKLIEENQHLSPTQYCEMPLHQAIEERLKDGYKGKTAVRKDAVKYLTHILTGSHDEMTKIWKDDDLSEKWAQKNYDFIAKKFGRENIIRFSIHLDERTPHIHVVTVPLTEDGRLSAKEIVGNNKNMEETQSLYAEYMKEFGLERGKRHSGATHRETKEFYADMKEVLAQRDTETKKYEGKIKELVNDKQSLENEIGKINKWDILTGTGKRMAQKNKYEALLKEKEAEILKFKALFGESAAEKEKLVKEYVALQEGILQKPGGDSLKTAKRDFENKISSINKYIQKKGLNVEFFNEGEKLKVKENPKPSKNTGFGK